MLHCLRACITVGVFESSDVVDIVGVCRMADGSERMFFFWKNFALAGLCLCVPYLNARWVVFSVMLGQCGQ